MGQYLRSIASLPRAVKWFLLTEMIFGFGSGIWSINLNFHLKACGFVDWSIGSVLAFGAVATAVLSAFAGGLCDRIGFHPAMMYGCIAKGAGMALIALSHSPLLVYGGFVVMSLGDSFVLSSEFPFILGLVEEKFKDLVYSLLICFFLFALFFGNIAGGYLPGLFSGMENSYFVPVLISGLLFILLGIARSFLPRNKVDYTPSRISFEIVKDRKIRTFLVYGMIMSLALNCLNSMLNIIYKDSFHMKDNMIGLAFSASTVVMFLSSFLAPLIMKRWRNENIALAVMLANLPLLLVMSFAGWKLFLPVWLLYSFLRLMLPGTVENRMLQAIPEGKQGAYSGMRIFAVSMGNGIGSFLAGLLLEYSSHTMVLLCCAVFTFLQLMTYLLGCRKHLAVSSAE